MDDYRRPPLQCYRSLTPGSRSRCGPMGALHRPYWASQLATWLLSASPPLFARLCRNMKRALRVGFRGSRVVGVSCLVGVTQGLVGVTQGLVGVTQGLVGVTR
eukprot:1695796-Pyramimonas_sp.AAC.1